MFIIVTTTVAYTPILDFIPGYPGNKSRTMLIENIMRLDSLEKEIKNMQIYNENVALIMAGKNPVTRNDMQTADSASRSKNPTVGAIIEDSILRSRWRIREALTALTIPTRPVKRCAVRWSFSPRSKESSHRSSNRKRELTASG